MKGICRGRAAIGRGGLEPPGPAFADQRVTFPGNRGDPGGRGLLLGFHVGSFRMVFHRLPYRSGGSWIFSSTFLAAPLAPRAGSGPGGLRTPTWERQIKEGFSVNKTLPSFPGTGQGGEEEPSGERTGKSTSCPWRGEGGRSGADPELQWRNSSVFCRGNHRMSWVGRDPEGSGPHHVSVSPPWLVPRAPSPGMRL